MRYAAVRLLTPAPGNPTSGRYPCKVWYPARYTDKDDIVPGIRIRLRPSNVEPTLPGVMVWTQNFAKC